LRAAIPTYGAVVAAIVGITLAIHIQWLVRFRDGYLTEWDESGYMQYALSNFDALHDHGIVEFAKTVGGRGTFGPLLPAVTALAYPVVGRGIFGSLLVPPVFFVLLVITTYGLGRQLLPEAWAVVAALAVAAMPAVTDYTRLFHFAVPATACMTAALWALMRSGGFLQTRWAIVFGLFVALTVLARTMTVAYLPGLALAAVIQVVGAPVLRTRLRNLGLATAVAALVAGPWYARNWRSVYDYLVNTGYGSEAASYGPRHAIASWGYWSKVLQADVYYLWLPLAAALALSFVAAVTWMVIQRRRPRPRSWTQSARGRNLLALTLVVVEGYLVLTSSRNQGSAFALPWLPVLVVLGVAAAATVPARAVRVALAGVFVVVSIGALLSKSGFVAPLATVRTTGSIPGFGSLVVTDGRGVIQQIVAGAGYDIGPPDQPLPSIHRRWLPLERHVVGWSLREAKERQQPLHLTLGLDDHLFANTRLHLAAQLWFHRNLGFDYLRSSSAGDTVAAYRHQLLSPRPENALVTGEPGPRETITRSKVEAAARSLGFVRLKSFTLPDGRTIWMWWRQRGET
jgi:hypothetical protein